MPRAVAHTCADSDGDSPSDPRPVGSCGLWEAREGAGNCKGAGKSKHNGIALMSDHFFVLVYKALATLGPAPNRCTYLEK